MIVWNIEQSGNETFSATYAVDQHIKEGEQTTVVKAIYTVKFLDNQTKGTQVSQYELVLHKDSNWKIVE